GVCVCDGVVLAVEPVRRGERRLEARLPLLALERFEERRLLTTDIGPIPVARMELGVDAAAKDVLSEVARGARLLERLLEALVLVPDLAVDVVVSDRRTAG